MAEADGSYAKEQLHAVDEHDLKNRSGRGQEAVGVLSNQTMQNQSHQSNVGLRWLDVVAGHIRSEALE